MVKMSGNDVPVLSYHELKTPTESRQMVPTIEKIETDMTNEFNENNMFTQICDYSRNSAVQQIIADFNEYATKYQLRKESTLLSPTITTSSVQFDSLESFPDYCLKYPSDGESTPSSSTCSNTSFFSDDCPGVINETIRYSGTDVDGFYQPNCYMANPTEWNTSLKCPSQTDLVNSVPPYPNKLMQLESECKEYGANIQGYWYNYDPKDKNIMDETSPNQIPSPVRRQVPYEHKKGQRSERLWEFIRGLLLNPKFNPSLAEWVDRRQGLFRFNQSKAVAQLWGSRKNNDNMTYEKLSRAMRYYYNRKILEPVIGKKLVYRFGPNSYGW